MRLSRINPWYGTPYAPPRKVDEAAADKPPDADEDGAGRPLPSMAPGDETPPGDAPPDAPSTHRIDITI